MEVVELAPRLWRWTARHPEWTPDQGGPEGWEPDVASFYCEAGGDILLIDPLVPADDSERERFWRALDRDVARVGAPYVVLTCAWHARSSGDVLGRYPGARLWAHADDLGELPVSAVATDPFRPGDALPGNAAAIAGAVGGPVTDVFVWLPSHAALVSGDTLLGDGGGGDGDGGGDGGSDGGSDGAAGIRLCPDSWLGGADPVAVRAGLRLRLEGLPVELVLPTHGEPVLVGGREALDRALGRALA